ncbi:HXXEE domain-containing protein [Pleomorphomonas koreensis]|uniref:HXXEE domain-containing protein n=1 Tax=Pleomorphomonas koreensis TaxID=257440 RepID=UPI00041C891C|nr:HXXEE domain-containing protein [Pleomorphomonas koreensis]
MKFLHRHWYDLSLFIGLAILGVLALWWDSFSILQRLSIANLAVIFFHFFEEFGFPGGFGKMANTLYFKTTPDPRRFPLNQNAVMIGNWSVAVLFYIPPIFFPQVMWLGLLPMLFGAMQMFAHGILNNVLLKRAGLRWGYNSGLVTAFFGHLPLAIAYGYYVETMGLASAWDWVIGAIGVVVAYGLVFRMLIMKNLEDEHSPWPFDDVEMARFDRLYGRKGTK